MADVQTAPTAEDLIGIIGMLVSGEGMATVSPERLPAFEPAGRIFIEACFTGWKHRSSMAALRQMNQQRKLGLIASDEEPPAAAAPVPLHPRPDAPSDAAMADAGG